MGSDALSRLWKQSEPRGPDRMVMAVLCDLAGYDGLVSVSQRAIGQMAAMPKATVAEAVNRLIRADHIKLIDAGGGHKKPSVYRLMLGDYSATKEDSEPEAQVPAIAGIDASAHDWWPTQKAATAAASLVKPTLADSMIADADPVATTNAARDSATAAAVAQAESRVIAEGHPHSLVGAILTALQIQPAPGDLFWFRQEHKVDAADLARLAGGEDALIERLRRAPAAKVPKGFRRLTALAGLVKEGRG